MKKLWLLLLFALPAFGQSPVIGSGVQYVPTAPSGSCSQAPPIDVLNANGHPWTCANGTWTDQGGGGGGIGYPSGTGVPEVTGGAAWGTTYNASNLIPANFLAVGTPQTSCPVTVLGPGIYPNNSSGACTFNLPTPTSSTIGACYTFTNYPTQTGVITITAPASTFISVSGANTAAAGSLVSAGSLGDSASLCATSTTQYLAYLQQGTWNGIGPGSGFAAGGDLSGSLTSQKVIGVNSVPLCAGFTPTTGQFLEYTTASSPNPCYTAAVPSGAGNVTGPGSSTSGDIATYNGTSGTTIQDSGIGAASHAMTGLNTVTSSSGNPFQANAASGQNIILESQFASAPVTLEYFTAGTLGAQISLNKVDVHAGGAATAAGIGVGFEYITPTTSASEFIEGEEYVVTTNDTSASAAADQITQLASGGTVGTVRTLKSNGLEYTTGNSATLTSPTTITSTTFVTAGLALPSVPVSTTVRGRCSIIWEQSTAANTVQFGIGNSSAPTDLYVMDTLHSGASGATLADQYTTITSTTTTAISGTGAPGATATGYKNEIELTLINAATAADVVTIYALTGSGSDAVVIEPGSYCEWFL